jgi:N-acetylmuramoyl-L-alanine amidase
VRHDRYGDRQRLQRGAVQLQRGHVPPGRSRGGRAQIIDDAHADVAVDIHADGGPAGGRGFTVLEPEPDGPNNGVIASSESFATIMRNAFAAGTPMPVSTYDGVDGLQPRNDLAGLNLTTVPKVLIETGNMRNATDASLLVATSFQQQAAAAMAEAITEFLTGHSVPIP